jgi:hypothetical protein
MFPKSFVVAVAALALAPTATTALAQVTNVECVAARSLSNKTGERIFFQSGKGLSAVKNDGKQLASLISSAPKRLRFIILTESEPSSLATVYSSIVRFTSTEDDWKRNPNLEKVYTYNNLRMRGSWIAFDQYQAFHKSNGSHQDLLEWFHVGPGNFKYRDLVSSSEFEFPRRFLAINEDRRPYEGIFSFLYALSGVNSEGSCYDLNFFLPPSSQSLSFGIRNLRATEGQYLPPFTSSVDFIK